MGSSESAWFLLLDNLGVSEDLSKDEKFWSEKFLLADGPQDQ